MSSSRVNASVRSVGKIADALGVTPARLLEDGCARLRELIRGNGHNDLLADMTIEEEKAAAHEGKDVDW